MLIYTFEEALELTGIRGIHPLNEDNDTLKYSFYTRDWKPYPYPIIIDDIVIVFIQSNLVAGMLRTINFADKFIVNNKFVSTRAKAGIGLPCIKSQVHYATEKGFQHIQLTALKSNKENWMFGRFTNYNGYKVWGKCGFIMYYVGEQYEFGKRMRQQNHSALDLISIYKKHDTIEEVKEVQRGRQIWEKIGFSWHGKFYLNSNSNSLCYNILHQS